MPKIDRLEIRNFAHIAEVDLSFGDLTVLVGAQGTGKSLALQWLKAALDGKHIIEALRQAGYTPTGNSTIIDLIFGAGMGAAWGKKSQVLYNSKAIAPKRVSMRGGDHERAFYIPAHRSMLISDGWASPFLKLSSGTPVVARIFSQNLYDRFSAHDTGRLFPQERVLKKVYREQIDESVFHGGKVGLEKDQQHAKRLMMRHGKTSIPFMTWTAGQREFTPLLLGMYHLLPGSQTMKRSDIDWVIIEEPEMGLHPRAITVVLLLVLELLWRGYRVVLPTHSPHVLMAIWMLENLSQYGGDWKLICKAFGIKNASQLRKVAEAALKKTYRVHSLSFMGDGRVSSKDISSLDPEDENEEISGWGGLTGLSSRFGDAVRQAVIESER